MRNIFKKIILLFSLLVFVNSYAQSSESFSKSILGTWEGKGTLFKQKASFKMKWENELDDKFVKLSFQNSFKDNSGIERLMKADAYYDVKQMKGYWFDSRGMMLPLKLEIEKITMSVLWGSELTERGKTIYTIVDKDQLSVQDFVYKDNSYVLFGEATYKRIKE